MNIYKKYVNSLGLVSVSMVAARLKGLILLPILTKALGVEQYGIFALIIVSISMLVPICTLKLDFALIRFLGHVKDKRVISKQFISVIGIIFSIVLFISVIVFFLTKYIALNIFGNINVQYLIKISIPLIFLTVTNQVMREYLRAFQEMKKYTAFQLMQTFGEIIITFILVLSGFGLLGAIYALLIVRTCTTAIGIMWIKPQINITIPSFAAIKPYFPFALPLLPVALGHILINVGDRYVIGYFLGSGSVGIYSASYSLGLLLSLFFAPIPIVLFPTISNLFENNKIEEIKKHLQYSLKYFLMLAIPSSFGLLVLSKPILVTLTTQEFLEGYLIVPVIALSIMIYSISDLNNQIIILYKKTKVAAVINIIAALLNIGMNIILIPIYGIMGAAVSTLITFVFHLIATSVVGYHRIPYHIEVIFILKSVISSIVMFSVLRLCMQYEITNLLVLVLVGVVFYFISLFVFRGLSKKELQFVKE